MSIPIGTVFSIGRYSYLMLDPIPSVAGPKVLAARIKGLAAECDSYDSRFIDVAGAREIQPPNARNVAAANALLAAGASVKAVIAECLE